MPNPRKPSIFDTGPARRDAARQIEQVNQLDRLLVLTDYQARAVGALLEAQQETNRLLGLLLQAQTGRPVPPPPAAG